MATRRTALVAAGSANADMLPLSGFISNTNEPTGVEVLITNCQVATLEQRMAHQDIIKSKLPKQFRDSLDRPTSIIPHKDSAFAVLRFSFKSEHRRGLATDKLGQDHILDMLHTRIPEYFDISQLSPPLRAIVDASGGIPALKLTSHPADKPRLTKIAVSLAVHESLTQSDADAVEAASEAKNVDLLAVDDVLAIKHLLTQAISATASALDATWAQHHEHEGLTAIGFEIHHVDRITKRDNQCRLTAALSCPPALTYQLFHQDGVLLRISGMTIRAYVSVPIIDIGSKLILHGTTPGQYGGAVILLSVHREGFAESPYSQYRLPAREEDSHTGHNFAGGVRTHFDLEHLLHDTRAHFAKAFEVTIEDHHIVGNKLCEKLQQQSPGVGKRYPLKFLMGINHPDIWGIIKNKEIRFAGAWTGSTITVEEAPRTKHYNDWRLVTSKPGQPDVFFQRNVSPPVAARLPKVTTAPIPDEHNPANVTSKARLLSVPALKPLPPSRNIGPFDPADGAAAMDAETSTNPKYAPPPLTLTQSHARAGGSPPSFSDLAPPAIPANLRVPIVDLPNGIRCWIQAQTSAHCYINALNTGLQQSVLTPELVAANITRDCDEPHPMHGWYHSTDIANTIQALSKGLLTLRACHPHSGHTTGATWESTLAAQSFDPRACPFVLLLCHPSSLNTAQTPHVVCAIRKQLVGPHPDWYLLDPIHPRHVAPLANDRVASFDADVFIVDYTDPIMRTPTPPTRQNILDLVKAPRARTERPPNTPRHITPVPPWPGYISTSTAHVWTATPITLRLFVPNTILHNRQQLLTICAKENLHLITYAKYAVENDHLRLTIVRQDHLAAMHCAKMATVAALVHESTQKRFRLTGWEAHQNNCAHPRKSNGRQIELSNKYSPLTHLLPDQISTHPQHTPPSTGRFSRDNVNATTRLHDTITLGTFNVRGLATRPAKLNAILDMMTVRNIGILAVQETHEKQHGQISPPATFAYFGEPSQPDTAHGGGGVGFLINATIAHAVHYLGSRATGKPFAPAWARIRGSNPRSDVYIASVYFPDAGKSKRVKDNARALLADDISHYSAKPGRILLLGDFNARVGRSDYSNNMEIQRGPQSGDPTTTDAGLRLLEMCADHDLYFLTGRGADPIPRTCRDASNVDHIIGSKSTLDWSPTSQVLDTYDAHLCHSDHVPVIISVPMTLSHQKPCHTLHRRWRLGNLQRPAIRAAYTNALLQRIPTLFELIQPILDCPEPPSQQQVDQVATAITQTVSSAAASTIGTKYIVPGKTKPWLSRSLAKVLAHRRHMHMRWLTAPTIDNAAALLAADKCAKVNIRAAKRSHNRAQAERTNKTWTAQCGSRDAWAQVKRLASPRAPATKIPALRTQSGAVVTEDDAVLEAMRTHYQRIATPAPDATDTAPAIIAHRQRITSAVADIIANPQEGPKTQDGPITAEEIESALNKLKRYKAAGDDDMPAELFKSGGIAVSRMLHAFFNIIWRSEHVPTTWRKGIVVSIFKQGDRTDCGNYRPITLLRVLDKMFLAILASRLQSTVTLHDHQFAFRPGLGTIDPIFTLASTIANRRRGGKRTYAFFLDVKKAYDTVWHPGLFHKLYHKGVTGRLWRMFHDIYTKGVSRALLNGLHSEPFPILQGVAQGCPASCMLFNIHIDDLPESLQRDHPSDGVILNNSSHRLVAQSYADDLAALSGTPRGLQRIIDSIYRHSLLWNWVPNTTKSHVVIFNPSGTADIIEPEPPDPRPPDTWHLGTHELPQHTTTKYLGVIFSADCSWNDHAAYAHQKGLNAYHALRGALRHPYLDTHIKLRLINTCIKPCITYAMEVWTPPLQTGAKLETTLHRSLRAALSIPDDITKQLFPSDLLLHDSNIRHIRTDNAAAHIRYHFKLRNRPQGSLPSKALAALPHTDHWLQRCTKWTRVACNTDPTSRLSDALAAPASTNNEADAAPGSASARSPNHMINAALAYRDHAAFINAATKRERPMLTITALQQPLSFCPQPYMAQRNYYPNILFRSGYFLDTATAAHVVRAPVGKRKRSDTMLAPPYLCCPLCTEPINSEHDSHDDTCRQHNVTVHRVTTCASMAAVSTWYHNVAVRICPSPAMASMLARVRALKSPNVSHDDPVVGAFIAHLLSPTSICDAHDRGQCRRMLQATSMFLSSTDASMRDLPVEGSFGRLPTVARTGGLPALRATSGKIDDAFWADVLTNVPFVPPQCCAPGHEAEAPVGVRRGPLRQCRGSSDMA